VCPLLLVFPCPLTLVEEITATQNSQSIEHQMSNPYKSIEPETQVDKSPQCHFVPDCDWDIFRKSDKATDPRSDITIPLSTSGRPDALYFVGCWLSSPKR